MIEFDFFNDKKCIKVFAKIDYHLRKGVHIQLRYPKPEELFRFIDKHYESLCSYYNLIFQVSLCAAGNDFDRYYYLDFEDRTRSNISSDNKETLKSEFVIIGLLFLKVYKLDGNIELASIKDFFSMLVSEYEEAKEALLRLIIGSNIDNSSDRNDDKLIDAILKAFNKFNSLGWIEWEDEANKDRFIYLPSFERLRHLYQSQILSIDEIIRQAQDGQ